MKGENYMSTITKRIMATALACVLTLLMLVVVYAAEETRASSLIITHSCQAAATGDGEIAIDFSITGKAFMARIGAQHIYVYAENGNTWTLEKHYGQYDEGTSKTDSVKHMNTIYYQGTAGVRYKVIVTLFAKNSSGTSDTRGYTFYLTA